MTMQNILNKNSPSKVFKHLVCLCLQNAFLLALRSSFDRQCMNSAFRYNDRCSCALASDVCKADQTCPGTVKRSGVPPGIHPIYQVQVAIGSLTGQNKTVKQKAHSVFNSETLKYPADCLNERSSGGKGQWPIEGTEEIVKSRPQLQTSSWLEGKTVPCTGALAQKGKYACIRKQQDMISQNT